MVYPGGVRSALGGVDVALGILVAPPVEQRSDDGGPSRSNHRAVGVMGGSTTSTICRAPKRGHGNSISRVFFDHMISGHIMFAPPK